MNKQFNVFPTLLFSKRKTKKKNFSREQRGYVLYGTELFFLFFFIQLLCVVFLAVEHDFEMFVLLIYVHTTHHTAIDEHLNDEIFGNKCLPSHNPNLTPTNAHTQTR